MGFWTQASTVGAQCITTALCFYAFMQLLQVLLSISMLFKKKLFKASAFTGCFFEQFPKFPHGSFLGKKKTYLITLEGFIKLLFFCFWKCDILLPAATNLSLAVTSELCWLRVITEL